MYTAVLCVISYAMTERDELSPEVIMICSLQFILLSSEAQQSLSIHNRPIEHLGISILRVI